MNVLPFHQVKPVRKNGSLMYRRTSDSILRQSATSCASNDSEEGASAASESGVGIYCIESRLNWLHEASSELRSKMCRLLTLESAEISEMKALYMLHHWSGKFVCLIAYLWIDLEPEVIRGSERQMCDARKGIRVHNLAYLESRIPSSMLPRSAYAMSIVSRRLSLSI
jgi:hypothetical protein